MNHVTGRRGVDHHWHEFVYTGDCGQSMQDRQGPGLLVHPVSGPVSTTERELRPRNGASPVNTEARARPPRMTNVAAAANVAAQQIIFRGDKIYLGS